VQLCPECREGEVDAGSSTCRSCGWQARRQNGILDLVAARDEASDLFSAYARLYDQIATNDLDAPIQGDALLDLEARRLVEDLGPLTGKAVCDIGVGRGLIFKRLLAEHPDRLVGIDLARVYLDRLRLDGSEDTTISLIRANAENLPFRDEFDVIVASDVMEHVLNVADFLESMVDALKPGGRLLVKVPYRENISQYGRSSGCPYPMVHLRTFDRALLRQTLKDAGLAVERIRYSGFYSERWQPPLLHLPRTGALLGRLIDLRYGKNPGPNRMNPRIARLLMRPVVISALAAKPLRGGRRSS
jgi:2-polyprenyl-3-methyl-5-hydroxy-6-metoxy-1,4-benzoquinol methylase